MPIASDLLFTFTIAAGMLSLSPGPSNLYIIARTLANGHTAGIAAAAGMAIGSVIYVIATALGLAAVFVYSPTAYLILKLAGAGYLLYLGIQTLFNSSRKSQDSITLRSFSTAAIFRQSIVVELTNPKTALFFLAFLPQFVDPQEGDVALQLLILGLVYSAIALSSDLFMVFMAHQLGKWLSKHPRFSLWQDRVSGSILLGLGSYIALQEFDFIQ